MVFRYSILTLALVALVALALPAYMVKAADKVKLVATDENGEPTNHLSPGKIVNLNCTYNVDPLFLNFYNGTDRTIFVRNFITGEQVIGAGFEKLVKSNTSRDGWLSIKFWVPHCYKDEVIKCAVIDQVANKHQDKRIFPIGSFHPPSKINDTDCGGMIEIQQDKFPLTCDVFGVQPEVTFTWSAGCTNESTVSIDNTTKCFFNQRSTALCQMDEDEEEMEVTCSANNPIDKGSCRIRIKRGEQCHATSLDKDSRMAACPGGLSVCYGMVCSSKLSYNQAVLPSECDSKSVTRPRRRGVHKIGRANF